MTTFSLDTTVGDIVRASPGSARTFERLGIDYCCGGKKPLDEACRARGLDGGTVLTMLTALAAEPESTVADASVMNLSALCDHIQQAHHDYLREELPRLDYMTRKVAAVHGADEPRLVEIRSIFEAFAPELGSHIVEEEQRIFPAIRELDQPAVPAATKASTRPALQAALTQLEQEHQQAGDALARFRELTNDYQPPEWACNTYRAMYHGLAQLERNMHQHVHKENNILFPRALAMA